MTYVEFATKLETFPSVTDIRTDMAHLHKVLGELRDENNQGPLPDISKVCAVDTPDFREGVEELVHSTVMGVAMGNGEPFSDLVGSFHIARTDIKISKHHASIGEVFIDITLVHNATIRQCSFFKQLVERLGCDQRKRRYC